MERNDLWLNLETYYNALLENAFEFKMRELGLSLNELSMLRLHRILPIF